jgi:heme/copper-type cytochrome/quinol oxidase subunit 2
MTRNVETEKTNKTEVKIYLKPRHSADLKAKNKRVGNYVKFCAEFFWA